MALKQETLIRKVQALMPRSRPPKRYIAGLLAVVFFTLSLRRQLQQRRKQPPMPRDQPTVPGFKSLSDQVFVRETDAAKQPGHPDVVLIYGWGDGIPKHVLKYAEGFATLYPGSKQLVILSPISKALSSTLAQRSLQMAPVVNELFPNGPSETESRSILIHCMSNTGGVNYAATINHFRNLYAQRFPHQLFVMDSTPGSVTFNLDNLKRWSRAMTIGMGKFFPLPFGVTQFLFAVFLSINTLIEKISGRESAGAWSRQATLDPDWEAMEARKLYMYSREDDLINFEDIETHAAQAKKLGWAVDVELFEGSGHVGHMRKHGEQYWTAIAAAWQEALADVENRKAQP